MCQNATCKEKRSVFVNSGKTEAFTCKHSEKVSSSCQSTWMSYCTSEKIQTYAADANIKSELINVIEDKPELPHVVQVSPTVFAVLAQSSASNPMGYVHVSKDSQFYSCTSKDCKTKHAKTKQLSAKKVCAHIHMLLCCLGFSEDENSNSNSDRGEPEGLDIKESLSRQNTLKLHANFKLPYEIDSNSLATNKELDCRTSLQNQNGWPELFEPNETLCGLCQTELGPSRVHPGSNGDAILLTCLNPFRKTKIRVKICQKTSCQAMHRVFPTELGLFNISDKVMLSMHILLEWRESFRRGVPVTVMIEAKIASLIKRYRTPYEECQIEKEYLVDLLYNGFYSFEAITERDLDSGICGICGIIGELYLGDGNEKNCCSTKNIEYPTQNEQSQPVALETFFAKIKSHWVEKTIYTRSLNTFGVDMVDIPPIIPPALRASNITITEAEKKSGLLKRLTSSSVEGDPAKLHHLIMKENLEISKLHGIEVQTLQQICRKCGIKTAGKSMSAMKLDVETLYATLLVGHSPCHQFTQVPGHTGGFYHLVCRHGCTVASKFLLLQESTRDPTDLYLSLRYPPLVFVCDTPCGVVRHMDCRNPEITKKLWGEFGGCFEKPSFDTQPKQDQDVPSIVPLEYRNSSITIRSPSNIAPLVHSISGNSRRYIMGDRFHSSTNPHKSPLCEFHNINLCRQANVFATSYQEMKNHQKNKKRLRSSCVQSFGVHFLYNYLMDFYDNEEIVLKQQKMLSETVPSKKIMRDEYKRFHFE